MGLDMNFFALVDGEREEIAYFRKHSDLHGWMEDLWQDKGNKGDCNGEYLILDADDLKALEAFAKQETHPKRTGFFWGQSTEEDWERTRKIIPVLKNYLDRGYKVIYSAWY